MTEESRQIYIGDMIKLTVDSSYASENDILEAFSKMEVVSVEDLGDVYEVTVRSFEPATYQVSLAGQQLEIVVGSTLDDLQQETVFEPEPLPGASVTLPYMTVILTAACIGLVAVIVLMVLGLRRKKETVATAYESFVLASEEKVVDSGKALAELTGAFKSYLVSAGVVSSQDGTTHAFREAMSDTGLPAELAEEIIQCLEQCDAIHYSPDKEHQTGIGELAQRIRHLAKAIDAAAKDVMV